MEQSPWVTFASCDMKTDNRVCATAPRHYNKSYDELGSEDQNHYDVAFDLLDSHLCQMLHSPAYNGKRSLSPEGKLHSPVATPSSPPPIIPLCDVAEYPNREWDDTFAYPPLSFAGGEARMEPFPNVEHCFDGNGALKESIVKDKPRYDPCEWFDENGAFVGEE